MSGQNPTEPQPTQNSLGEVLAKGGSGIAAVDSELNLGFLSKLCPVNFPRNRNGEEVYYPWAPFGSGRVLKDEATKQKLRAVLQVSSLASTALVVMVVLFGWKYFVFALLVYVCWLIWRTRAITADCPLIENPGIKNFYVQSASVLSDGRLWYSFIVLIFFAAICLAGAFYGHSILERLVAGLGALFFCAITIATAFMLKVKHPPAPRS